jgi:hypothetical protein
MKTPKPYEKPTISQLTPGQAKLKLIGHVLAGERGAAELLELISANPVEKSA